MLASIVEVMLPKSVAERWLGVGSGFKGMAVATFAGAFTPGGPFLAFPMVSARYCAGADVEHGIPAFAGMLAIPITNSFEFP